MYIKTLIVDFGLVVLIWMTQLVVYPSFTYYSESSLADWHVKYTSAITFIVMPLMLAQVAFHAYDLFYDFSWLGLLGIVLIALAWSNTFFYAVPLHKNISEGNEILKSAHELVRINWYRTILWSGVFLVSLIQHIKN